MAVFLQAADLIVHQPPITVEPGPFPIDVSPKEPGPCYCNANVKKFRRGTIVYCPRHGEEPANPVIMTKRRPIILNRRRDLAGWVLKRPPHNCANGFIIKFANQEELFCKPLNIQWFFSQTLEDQFFHLVLAVKSLEEGKISIFGNTVYETNTTYFEVAQTTIDLQDQLDWAPLGPGYSHKFLLKNWQDSNGKIIIMVRRIASTPPQIKDYPLHNRSSCLEATPTINVQMDSSVVNGCMQVTFLGIRNPWYYSRSVPYTSRSCRVISEQLQENHLTSSEVKLFEDSLLSIPPRIDNIMYFLRDHPTLPQTTPYPLCVPLETILINYLSNMPLFNVANLAYHVPPALYAYLSGFQIGVSFTLRSGMPNAPIPTQSTSTAPNLPLIGNQQGTTNPNQLMLQNTNTINPASSTQSNQTQNSTGRQGAGNFP